MKKISILFPGQGTQFVGMGKFFFDNYDIVKRTFQEISETSGIDIVDICFNGDTRKINDFINMQLVILAVEVSIFRVYMEVYGVYPQFAVGHSVGEYAAFVSTGAISLTTAVRILLKRGELVQRIISQRIGHMTIVENCSAEIIEQCIHKANATNYVYVSCYNASCQNVISGYNAWLDKIEDMLCNEDANCTPLLLSPPIHSKIMDGICNEFFDYINSFEFYDFRFPIISNVTGDIFSDKHLIAEMFTKQLCYPIKFLAVQEVMYKYGVNITIEMSPKNLLSNFVKMDYPDINTLCFGVKNDRVLMEELFTNKKMYSRDASNFFGRCLSIIASSENKNDDTEEYKEVIRIYNWLVNLYNVHLADKKELSRVEIKSYIGYLVKVLKIKKVEELIIREYIKDLLEETNLFYEMEE